MDGSTHSMTRRPTHVLSRTVKKKKKCISTVIVNLCYKKNIYYIYVYDYTKSHFLCV